MLNSKKAKPNKTKQKKIPAPENAQCIQFVTGDVRPLFVASKDVERIVIGFNRKTAANLRSLKRGPRFYMVRGTPYYRVSDLEDYFSMNPVETFGNGG